MPAIINGRYRGSCEYWSGSRITCQGGRAVQSNKERSVRLPNLRSLISSGRTFHEETAEKSV